MSIYNITIECVGMIDADLFGISGYGQVIVGATNVSNVYYFIIVSNDLFCPFKIKINVVDENILVGRDDSKVVR